MDANAKQLHPSRQSTMLDGRCHRAIESGRPTNRVRSWLRHGCGRELAWLGWVGVSWAGWAGHALVRPICRESSFSFRLRAVMPLPSYALDVRGGAPKRRCHPGSDSSPDAPEHKQKWAHNQS